MNRFGMNYLRKLALVLLLPLAATACGERVGSEEQFHLNTLTVTGGAYDRITGEPAWNITIILDAMDPSGDLRLTPVRSDTTIVRYNGYYQFILPTPAQTKYYTLRATDMSSERQGGQYRSSSIELFINTTSQAYDPLTKSYTLSDNNFYLDRAEK